MTESVKIAILGLGDAGWLLANGLKNAGANVLAFDSTKPKFAPCAIADSLDAALRDADLVLAINPSMVSVRIAEQAAQYLKPGALYADLNPGTPNLTRKLADLIGTDRFVDGAIMTPVAKFGEGIRIAISGEEAARLAELLSQFGIAFNVVSNQVGEASARYLLKALMQKGLASVITDTLWAAKELGLDDWAIQEIKAEFASADEATVQRYLNEAASNPKRRSVEVGELSEFLTEAGYESSMLNGMGLTFSHIMHGRKIPFAELD